MTVRSLTVVCVDTVSPASGFRALQRTAELLPWARRLFITSHFSDLQDERVSFRQIGAFRDVGEYSNFILMNLVDYIDTTHLLLVQWDGFAVNAEKWDDEFLRYDYIGAPWPQFNAPQNVGNGGFSLRSRRLMEALRDPRLTLHDPEDVCICLTNRAVLEERHGLRFAPADIAASFAYERGPVPGPTFGFHGLFNFPLAMPQSYREEILALPTTLLNNRDAIDLAAWLCRSENPDDRSLACRIAGGLVWRRPMMLGRLARAWFNG